MPGIPTIIIFVLFHQLFARLAGTPRAVAPLVPMGANAGGPHNVEQQTQIVKATLEQLVEIQTPGKDCSTAIRASDQTTPPWPPFSVANHLQDYR